MWAGFGARLSLLVVSLFTIIGMTWIALIWLSLVRQYDDILRAYVYGTLVAMMGVLLVFLSQGTEPIFAAYTAGQAFTLVLLLRTILRGMDTGEKRDYRVFRSLISFPVLAGVGFAYNAAIWVDKMIFWFADGIGPHRLVRYHPLYDTCSYLAYLTVVPALALNLVQLETAFYENYRAYYGAILAGSPLAVIERNKARMFESLQEGVVRLLRLQGAITAAVVGVVLNLAVWFAKEVLYPPGAGLDGFALGVSAIALIGLVRFKWDVIPVVIGSGFLGLAWSRMGGGGG